MCLYAITKKQEPTEEVFTAYKVVDEHDNTTCYPVKLTCEWQQADCSINLIPNTVSRKNFAGHYRSGFHVLPNLAGAQAFLESMQNWSKSATGFRHTYHIAKVEVKGVHTIGVGDGLGHLHCPAWVCDYIRLAEDQTLEG